MTETKIRVALVGLDTLGASLGLALAQAQTPLTLERVGHDPNPLQAQEARRLGAVDRVALTLAGAVEGADIVVLSLPLAETRKTLAVIGDLLRPDAVVLDTCPARAQAAAWAREHLPPDRHYVGLVPVLNPAYLLDETAPPAADAFCQTVMGVVGTPDTPAAVLRLAADFCTLVGSRPVFLDAAEADAVLAAVEVFPQLLAAAWMQTATRQAGWLERRKFASRAFARITAWEREAADLAPLALAHREALGGWLRFLGEQLQALGVWLAQGDEEALCTWLEDAAQGRATWWRDRQRNTWERSADSTPPPPGLGETLGRLIGLRRHPRSEEDAP